MVDLRMGDDGWIASLLDISALLFFYYILAFLMLILLTKKKKMIIIINTFFAYTLKASFILLEDLQIRP